MVDVGKFKKEGERGGGAAGVQEGFDAHLHTLLKVERIDKCNYFLDLIFT